MIKCLHPVSGSLAYQTSWKPVACIAYTATFRLTLLSVTLSSPDSVSSVVAAFAPDKLVVYLFAAWTTGHDAGTEHQGLFSEDDRGLAWGKRRLEGHGLTRKNVWVCHYQYSSLLQFGLAKYMWCFGCKQSFIMIAHACAAWPAACTSGDVPVLVCWESLVVIMHVISIPTNSVLYKYRL